MYKLTVEFKTKEELLDFLSTDDVVVAKIETEEKPVAKKKAKKKAEPKVEEPAETEELPETEPKLLKQKAPVEEAPVEEKSGDLDYKKDVLPIAMELVQDKTKGKPALSEILDSFGVANGQELEVSQYGDFVAELKKKLAE